MRFVQFGNDKLTYYKGILQKASGNLHNEVLSITKKYLLKSKCILDFGCGEGAFSKRLIDEGFIVDACDVDKDQLKVNVSKFIHLDLNNENILANFDNRYHAIYSLEVIEHIENPWKYIRDIKSLLNDDGYLFISTPNISNFSSRIRFFLRGTFQGFEKQDLTYGHITPINSVHFENILKTEGFEIIEKKYLGNLPLFHFNNISIFAIFRNTLGPVFFPFMKGDKCGWCLMYILKLKK